MTQICSAIKPCEKFFSLVVTEESVGETQKLPDDFISFSDSPVYFSYNESTPAFEVGGNYIKYVGYNSVRCDFVGTYHIPYNARWFFFTKDTHNATVLDIPADICDALPSYIASQCLKIDDEVKSAIFRNEYEMFLSRIDDSSTRSQKDMFIGGGW